MIACDLIAAFSSIVLAEAGGGTLG